ncbi:MAG: pentapeptide repeat-containing protein [Bdellovibrionota bacterium]
MSFIEEDFSEQVFEALEQRGLKLQDKHFEACTFRRCNFGGAAFSRSRFVGGSFEHCDLSNVQLAGAALRDVTFRGCKLMGVNWAMCSSVAHLTFEDCVLDLSAFVGLDLRKSVIRNCRARETDFADANLSEANCQGTDFAGARFSRTNLTKADFRRALNYTIRPDDNKLKKARFSLPEATLLLHGLDIVLEE